MSAREFEHVGSGLRANYRPFDDGWLLVLESDVSVSGRGATQEAARASFELAFKRHVERGGGDDQR